jgi:hypothetical protein
MLCHLHAQLLMENVHGPTWNFELICVANVAPKNRMLLGISVFIYNICMSHHVPLSSAHGYIGLSNIAIETIVHKYCN